jgi:hypothetical protein
VARDLDAEDRKRDLISQQAELERWRSSPPYRLLEERIQRDKSQISSRLANGHRDSDSELRVLQGEYKAYNNVLVMLERELSTVKRELAAHG